jgi:hypothetical protein
VQESGKDVKFRGGCNAVTSNVVALIDPDSEALSEKELKVECEEKSGRGW